MPDAQRPRSARRLLVQPRQQAARRDLATRRLDPVRDHAPVRPAVEHHAAGSDAPTVGSATVYPLTTLLRIVSAQVLAIALVR